MAPDPKVQAYENPLASSDPQPAHANDKVKINKMQMGQGEEEESMQSSQQQIPQEQMGFNQLQQLGQFIAQQYKESEEEDESEGEVDVDQHQDLMNQEHEPEIVNQIDGVMDTEDEEEYQQTDENDNILSDGQQPGGMIVEDQLDDQSPVDDVEEADQQFQNMNASLLQQPEENKEDNEVEEMDEHDEGEQIDQEYAMALATQKEERKSQQIDNGEGEDDDKLRSVCSMSQINIEDKKVSSMSSHNFDNSFESLPPVSEHDGSQQSVQVAEISDLSKVQEDEDIKKKSIKIKAQDKSHNLGNSAQKMTETESESQKQKWALKTMFSGLIGKKLGQNKKKQDLSMADKKIERQKKQNSASKKNDKSEKEALKMLGRSEKIGISEARKVTHVPFYHLRSETEMIEKEADRPMMIFKQVLMKNPVALRLQSREKLLEQKKKETELEKSRQIKEIGDDSYDDEGLDDDNISIDQKKSEKGDNDKACHALDIICSLYYASDHAVREMMTKNFHCSKIATPFILPSNKMLLYPYLSTQLTWNSFDQPQEPVFHKGVNVFKQKCPVIAFIRVGECKFSKSKLINDLFFDQRPTFLHRGICSNTAKKSEKSNGLVEIQWYTPVQRQREEGQVNDLTTILNLRGDAAQLKDKVSILKQFSDLVVILADSYKSFKGELFKTAQADDRNFLWVTEKNDAPQGATVINERFMQLVQQGDDHSVQQILKKIAQKINPDVNNSMKQNSIEKLGDLYQKENFGLVDINDKTLKKAKELAIKFEQSADKYDKSEIVPLQSNELWGQYTQCMKKLQRFNGQQAVNDLQKERDALLNGRDQARRKQREKAMNLNAAMKTFIKVLNEEDPETAYYFIESVTLYLNQRNSRDLKDVNQRYVAAFNKLQSAKQKKEDFKAHQQEVEQEGQRKIELSFGLEHMLRECGQIYECLQGSQQGKNFLKLPFMVAKLVLKGLTIEFMDGENAYIPTIWISAILKGLENICGEEPVHVQSIIGTQSSGKSTFLNCQYNSKFAVAAERCTKGIYFQLLEIDDELRKQKPYRGLKSKYIINLDTEGLRAPELVGNYSKSIKHDNEMGTFIISIADMTTLNIDGLSNITSMAEILDIVVHAVLKIKDSVHMEPQIHFVHQKVDDSNPEVSNREARLKITQALDTNTMNTAKMLNKPGVSQFSDVIPTDTHASYVNSLFEGAPGNQAYSSQYLLKAQSLKMKNIETAVKLQSKSNYKVQSFSTVGKKLQLLWDCILAENFSFAFQNASAIVAFKDIEKIQRNHYEQIIEKVQDKKNQLDQELSAAEGYKTCTEDKIKREMIKLEAQLLTSHEEVMQKEIKDKITDDGNETIKKYEFTSKQNIMSHIKEMCRQVRTNLEQKCKTETLKGEVHNQLEDHKQKLKTDLVQYYQDHKDEMQGKEDDALEKIFYDKFWLPKLEEFKANGLTKPIFVKEPAADIIQLLQADYSDTGSAQKEFSYFVQKGHLFPQEFLKKERLQLKFDFLTEKNREYYINLQKKQEEEKEDFSRPFLRLFSGNSQPDVSWSSVMTEDRLLQSILKNECADLKSELRSKYYDTSTMRDCLKQVQDLVNETNNQQKMKFVIQPQYELMCKAILLQKLYPTFLKQIETEQEQSDPFVIMEKKLYPTLVTNFQVLAKNLNANEKQAMLVGKEFVRLIVQKLQSEGCYDNFFHDKKGEAPIFTSKKALVSKSMKDILDGQVNYEKSQQFLRSFKSYAKELIREKLEEILSKDEVQQWAKVYTTNLIDRISSVLRTSLEKSSNHQETIETWLPQVVEKISAEGKTGAQLRISLPISVASFKDSVDLEHKLSVEGTETARDGLRKTFLETILNQLDAEAIYENCDIAQNIDYFTTMSQGGLGCLNSCEFCGASCDFTQSGHKEHCMSDLHRILGVDHCRKGQKLITHKNCNKEVVDNEEWRVYAQVFLESGQLVKQKDVNGKACVKAPIRELLDVAKWEIQADITKTTGDVFWKWYFRKYEQEIIEAKFNKPADDRDPTTGFTVEPSTFGDLKDLEDQARKYLDENYE